MNDANLADYEWLVTDHARPWIEQAAVSHHPLAGLANTLRRHLTPLRTHLVLELVRLRRRAVVKFDRASEMFFTSQGLEQSSDQWIAAYKAERMGNPTMIADLCCGLGGDLMGLARSATVIGLDRDPIACCLADANCRVHGYRNVEIRKADVADFDAQAVTAWHIDPDRRPSGRRTAQVELHSPGPQAIDDLRRACQDGALKLAPAAKLPPPWVEVAEREWIGHRRECQQLIVWFGRLARRPGQAVATIVSRQPPFIRSVTGEQDQRIELRSLPRRYVFEPHSAVLAARLTGALAGQLGLAALAPRIPYLTGNTPVDDLSLNCFELIDVLPLDMKRLKAVIRQRRIARLEVKKRGVAHDPQAVRRTLQVEGDEQATLILTRIGNRAAALLTRRVK